MISSEVPNNNYVGGRGGAEVPILVGGKKEHNYKYYNNLSILHEGEHNVLIVPSM